MKVQYQILEEGTEIELLSTTNHKEANDNFGEFKIAPCRTVGNKINVNGERPKEKAYLGFREAHSRESKCKDGGEKGSYVIRRLLVS